MWRFCEDGVLRSWVWYARVCVGGMEPHAKCEGSVKVPGFRPTVPIGRVVLLVFGGNVGKNENENGNGETKTMEYELKPKYDSRNSFYHKATVSIVDTKSDDGTSYELYSYGTLVARYCDGTGVVELLDAWCQTPTTLRHVKEFLAQMNPLYAGWSKSDIQRELVEA